MGGGEDPRNNAKLRAICKFRFRYFTLIIRHLVTSYKLNSSSKHSRYSKYDCSTLLVPKMSQRNQNFRQLIWYIILLSENVILMESSIIHKGGVKPYFYLGIRHIPKAQKDDPKSFWWSASILLEGNWKHLLKFTGLAWRRIPSTN